MHPPSITSVLNAAKSAPRWELEYHGFRLTASETDTAGTLACLLDHLLPVLDHVARHAAVVGNGVPRSGVSTPTAPSPATAIPPVVMVPATVEVKAPLSAPEPAAPPVAALVPPEDRSAPAGATAEPDADELPYDLQGLSDIHMLQYSRGGKEDSTSQAMGFEMGAGVFGWSCGHGLPWSGLPALSWGGQCVAHVRDLSQTSKQRIAACQAFGRPNELQGPAGSGLPLAQRKRAPAMPGALLFSCSAFGAGRVCTADGSAGLCFSVVLAKPTLRRALGNRSRFGLLRLWRHRKGHQGCCSTPNPLPNAVENELVRHGQSLETHKVSVRLVSGKCKVPPHNAEQTVGVCEEVGLFFGLHNDRRAGRGSPLAKIELV